MKKNKYKKISRKGSATVEFVIILPLVLLLCLVIWQAAVAGLAIFNSQEAIQEAVRIAAVSEDEERAKKKAYDTFSNTKYYKMKNVKVKIKKQTVKVSAQVEIDLIFIEGKTITYLGESKGPVF